jgi:hypothetical protein
MAVFIAALAALLAVLLRSLDLRRIRDKPHGLLSSAGVWGVVGGGFLVGAAYGFAVGAAGESATWEWAGRGVIDGLIVACAGAFYLGYQQRKQGPGSGEGGRGGGDDGPKGGSELGPDERGSGEGERRGGDPGRGRGGRRTRRRSGGGSAR